MKLLICYHQNIDWNAKRSFWNDILKPFHNSLFLKNVESILLFRFGSSFSTAFFSNKRRSTIHIHDKIGEGPMKLILNQDLLREALLATLKLNASRILQHFLQRIFHKESQSRRNIFSSHVDDEDVMCITYKIKRKL